MKMTNQRENDYRAECIKHGREVLSAREATRLFGVPGVSLRQSAFKGKIVPTFTLTVGRGVPLYRLSDLQAYLIKYTTDPEILARMRENGITCAIGNESLLPTPSVMIGWLLLTFEPGLRSWEEASK